MGWIPMLLIPGTLLTAIFGPGYGEAAPILVVLTLGYVSSVVAGVCGVALTMSHHEGLVGRVMWAALVVRAPLGLGAAAAFGPGALAATADWRLMASTAG